MSSGNCGRPYHQRICECTGTSGTDGNYVLVKHCYWKCEKASLSHTVLSKLSVEIWKDRALSHTDKE